MHPSTHSTEPVSRGLLDRCRRREAAALDELAVLVLPRIWRAVVLSCGHRPESEDLVQTAAVRMIEKLDSFRGDGAFFGWLDRLTVNVVRGHYRRTRLFDGILQRQRDHLSPEAEPSPDRLVDGHLAIARIARHMGFLPEKHRLALALSLSQERTVMEIGAALGCSPEAAKKRLQRGREQLLARLRKDPYCEHLVEAYLS